MKKTRSSNSIIFFLKTQLINLLIVFLAGTTFWAGSSMYNNFSKSPRKNQPVDLEKLLNMTKTNFEIKTGIRPQVEILNGCGISGIALNYAKFLRDYGFDVTDYKNADKFDYDSTQIILLNGSIEQAHELATLMHINFNQIHISDLEKIENLILIIGKDYVSLDSFFNIEWTTP